MNLTYEQKIYLAQSSTATAEQLEKLANDDNSNVRYCVAQNPNCPEYLKKRLCHSLK